MIDRSVSAVRTNCRRRHFISGTPPRKANGAKLVAHFTAGLWLLCWSMILAKTGSGFSGSSVS
jgi:hypothetical protein